MKQFQFYEAPVRNTRSVKTMTIADAYSYITTSMRAMESTHQLRSLLERVKRGEADVKEARRLKAERFDFCTFSGTFSHRADDALLCHSGYICLDFDHVGTADEIYRLRNLLVEDEYFTTLLAFVSPSGDGLKWVVSIDTERGSHDKWFAALSNYVRATYNIECDAQCANISRACFLPFDATCYVAEGYSNSAF